MAERQDLLVGIEENRAAASGNNAAATATQAAPGVGLQLFITGFSFSETNVAPAAGATYTLSIRQNGGAVTRRTFLIPSGAFIAPIIYEFKRPLKVPENQDADIQVSALGVANAISQVELLTITRPVTGGA